MQEQKVEPLAIGPYLQRRLDPTPGSRDREAAVMYQPRRTGMYQTGSDLRGVLIARASGQPMEKFFRDALRADRHEGPRV